MGTRRRSLGERAARWRSPRPEIVEPANGVSSFHLWWQELDGIAPVVEVSAVLTVVEPPVVDRLYFWALQASFLDARTSYGGAHVGLQWNPRHPHHRAVNWGGYADPPAGGILPGSDSPLPSTPNDPNTRDYPWAVDRPYRFTISRGRDGWDAYVEDVSAGRRDRIRSLHAGGDRLGGLVVWSEVFAACSDPPVVVRWSGLSARTAGGREIVPRSVRVNFEGAGACQNTDVRASLDGIEQLSGVARTARNGSVLPIPDRPGSR
jgi:hypothetical protein